jgi:DNA polymerase
MNSPSAQSLTLNELFQLMHFYAEAGVDTLIEDEPQDRFAEFATLSAQRAGAAQRMPIVPTEAPAAQSRAAPSRPVPPPAVRPSVAIPDAEAVAEAKRIALAAESVGELAAAVAGFTGCNLRNSARNTSFLRGDLAAEIIVAAGMPSADDDRDGQPFSGQAGPMLERMLGGIGLSSNQVMLLNLIPWRPPGNRAPTIHEIDICRPFGSRLIELVRPKAVLALGNFPARFFSGSTETIHALRGRWLEVDVNGRPARVMPTFHPQDLMAAPPCKRLAWQDLLAFRRELTN